MKKLALLVLPIAMLLGTVGCDEFSVSDEIKSLIAAQPISADALGLQTQTQSQLQLQDGTCIGDGNQYGGVNGQGGNDGSGGNGDGDRDRLRDGSCGD